LAVAVIRRATWLLLWSGGLALLAAGVFAIQLGLDHDATRRFLAGGLVAVVLWALLERAALRAFLAERRTQFEASSALLVGLAGAASVLAVALALRHDHTWDLTDDRAWTLSDQSASVAASLTERIEVLAFFRPATPEHRDFQALVDLYRERTDQLDVQWLDPLKDVRLAQEHTVTSDAGTVILRRPDGRMQRVEGTIDEEHVTRGLLLLVSGEDHDVCWAMGHGEPDPDDEMSADGLGSMVLAVEALNYRVRRVVVPTEGLPADCDVLVAVSPKADWLPAEREALAAYVGGGGRALLLLDAGQAPELAGSLDRFGVAMPHDVVFDLNEGNLLLGVNDPAMVVLTFEGLTPHVITRDLGAALVLGIARSVAFDAGREGLKGTELLTTGVDAWAERTPEAGEPRPDEGVDEIGSVPVMSVVEVTDPAVLGVVSSPPAEAEGPVAPASAGVPEGWTPKAGGRLAVIGDADWASNQLLSLGNNRDLFLNTLAWLVDETEQIGERPDMADRLEVDTLSGVGLGLGLLVFVPGFLGIGAVGTLLRRRWL
jgi:hypothetical protein